MKKSYLFLALMLSTAVFAIAQRQPEQPQLQDIFRQPELLTPELSLLLAQYGPDEQGFLPPSYNLLDSVYSYSYDQVEGDWQCYSKNYQTRSCETGNLLVSLDKNEVALPGAFENYRKEEWSYYPDGTSKEIQVYNWNPTTESWLHVAERLFNEAGEITYDWSTYYDPNTGLIAGGYRVISSYDNNNLLSALSEMYDPASSNWIPDNRRTYEYSNGLLTHFLAESFVNGNWEFDERTSYTYDATGKLMESLDEDFLQGVWEFRERSNFTYNAAGLETLELVEAYALGNWDPARKKESSYHSNNQLSLVQHYIWVEQTQSWLPADRSALDDQGNYLEYVFMGSYYFPSNSFSSGFRLFYTLAATGNTEKIIAQELEPNTFDNWLNFDSVLYSYDANFRVEEYISHRWSNILNSYYFNSRYQYFNTGCLFNGTQEKTEDSPVCGMTNPLKLGQAIHCPNLKEGLPYRLEIYAMTGARIHAQPFQSGQAVTAQGLVPGIYLLTIRDGRGGMVQCSKVVVE